MAGGTWRVACCLFRKGGGHGGYCFFRICDANRNWFLCAVVSAAISAWLTASHPNSEVKQIRAGVVLRWGTTREGPVLRFLFFLFSLSFFHVFCCLFFAFFLFLYSSVSKLNPFSSREGLGLRYQIKASTYL